jgi:hypothetical protein
MVQVLCPFVAVFDSSAGRFHPPSFMARKVKEDMSTAERFHPPSFMARKVKEDMSTADDLVPRTFRHTEYYRM